MKNIPITLIALLILPFSAAAEKLSMVETCSLGANNNSVVSIMKAHPILDSNIYYLQQQQQKPHPVFQSKEMSRGAEVLTLCAGQGEHVLIISGEFTSNYIQGFAVRYNVAANEFQRINFAERNRPKFIYLTENKMLVVFSNTPNESSKKYLIYQYISGKGQSEAAYGADQLPRKTEAEKIILN
jgi:hypothetical protein